MSDSLDRSSNLPPDDEGALAPVPMFPLAGIFLFPGQLMPLHIFEPRYRQMVEDSLDTSGRIVMATVRRADEAELPGTPPVAPIAGIGEITKYERLPDGRFALWLFGLDRVRIEEVPSDRPYRTVLARPIEPVEPTRDDSAELRPLLIDAIEQRSGTDMSEHSELQLGSLCDMLALLMATPESTMLSIHGETDVSERARKVLSAHAEFPRRET